MKKVWKYVIITLLMLLGLFCVGVLYLFFVPNSSLFGITYINNNKKLPSKKYEKDAISGIVLNSRAYDINILTSPDSTIYAEAKSQSFGFVLKENKNFNITSSVKNNVLTINIIEPYGFATPNASLINLYLPKNKAFDLTLNNKKAQTTVSSNDVKINNLSYSTEKGDFFFKQGCVEGEMNLNINKGDFTIYENVKLNSNPLKLKTTKGDFSAEYHTLGDVTILSNSTGNISIKQCARFEHVLYSAGGKITLNKVSFIEFVSSNTNLEVGEILNGADINITDTGYVNINKLTEGNSFIATNSGNININTLESGITLKSNSGNISVHSAKKHIILSINSGNAFINFNESAESYKDDSSKTARKLSAIVHNGSLTAYGVENVGVVAESDEGIQITGNGKVNIYMKNVYGHNEIRANNGSVNTVVEHDSVYVLKTQSNFGSVLVNLTQTHESGGYKDKTLRTTHVNCKHILCANANCDDANCSEDNCLHATDLLLVTSNYGNLKVVDTNFD